MERILIQKDGPDHHLSTCEHSFHPGCLITAARVAGFGPHGNMAERSVELSCPVCRAQGNVPLEIWVAGAQQLANETE